MIVHRPLHSIHPAIVAIVTLGERLFTCQKDEAPRRQQQHYVAALEQSGVRPVQDSSFSLDQLADAFRYQASGAHFGKVAVEW